MSESAIERSVVTALDARDGKEIIYRLNKLATDYLPLFEDPEFIDKISLKPTDELISLHNLARKKYHCDNPEGDDVVSLNMIKLINLIVGRIVFAKEIIMECCDEYSDIPYVENGAINILTKQEFTKDYTLAVKRPVNYMIIDRRDIPAYFYFINKITKPGADPVEMIIVNNGYDPTVLDMEEVRKFIDKRKIRVGKRPRL